jgi:hypothetical protein
METSSGGRCTNRQRLAPHVLVDHLVQIDFQDFAVLEVLQSSQVSLLVLLNQYNQLVL